jgi:hypothetical protein
MQPPSLDLPINTDTDATYQDPPEPYMDTEEPEVKNEPPEVKNEPPPEVKNEPLHLFDEDVGIKREDNEDGLPGEEEMYREAEPFHVGGFQYEMGENEAKEPEQEDTNAPDLSVPPPPDPRPTTPPLEVHDMTGHQEFSDPMMVMGGEMGGSTFTDGRGNEPTWMNNTYEPSPPAPQESVPVPPSLPSEPSTSEIFNTDFHDLPSKKKRPISDISQNRRVEIPPQPNSDPNPPSIRHERTQFHNDPLYTEPLPLSEQLGRNFHPSKRVKGPAHEEHIGDENIRKVSYRDLFDNDLY